jgi:hypothetical protein
MGRVKNMSSDRIGPISHLPTLPAVIELPSGDVICVLNQLVSPDMAAIGGLTYYFVMGVVQWADMASGIHL